MCVIPARDAAPMFSGVQIPPPTPIRSVTHVTSIPILSRVTRTFLPAGFFPQVLLPRCAAASAARSLAPFVSNRSGIENPGLGPALRCRGFGSFYGILCGCSCLWRNFTKLLPSFELSVPFMASRSSRKKVSYKLKHPCSSQFSESRSLSPMGYGAHIGISALL